MVKPIDITLLLFPQFQILDASGPLAVFEIANELGAQYRVKTVSVAGGEVVSSAGVAFSSDRLSNKSAPHTLLVAGGNGSRPMRRGDEIAVIKELAPRCQRVASICTGVFLLAAAGLLDGKPATTHWQAASQLQKLFPQVQVQSDKIWVRAGHVWSSAGVSAGIDLALALVKEDYGDTLARQVAQGAVVYYQRPGGQSQFSSVNQLASEAERFAPLFAWVREHLANAITVEDMAAVMAMSARNFSRQFRGSLGQTPAKMVEKLRLEEARRLLQDSCLSVAQVARASGFQSAERMRRTFVRHLGRAPQSFRSQANSSVTHQLIQRS